ncbi:MAG: LemA family protein [Cyclonatronaceae bacterium]
MKKNRVIIGGLFLLVILVLSALSVGNTIRLNHAVMKSWMQLEREYERRNDLIPNLTVLVPDYDETLREAIDGMAGHRLAAIDNQRRAVPREPGYMGAIKSRLNRRFVMGSEHFLRDSTRFYSNHDAQQGISDAVSLLITSHGVNERVDDGDSFGNAVQLLERTALRIERSESRFSNKAHSYNRSVSSFPGRLYSDMLGLHKVLVITDRSASQ